MVCPSPRKKKLTMITKDPLLRGMALIDALISKEKTVAAAAGKLAKRLKDLGTQKLPSSEIPGIRERHELGPVSWRFYD